MQINMRRLSIARLILREFINDLIVRKSQI
jgi:hypothetical protein